MTFAKLTQASVMAIVFVVFSMTSQAASDAARDAIAERIKPVGEVCLQGDSNCGSATAAASGPFDPEKTYNTTCTGCHSTGAAGAPKVGDKAAWKGRLANGIDVVYEHAINGLNGMPPKGMCSSCSDDDIKAIVDYMVENSK